MELLYNSTRNKSEKLTASMAILKVYVYLLGCSVPEWIPKLSMDLDLLKDMSYQETAYEVMRRFLTDFTEEELKDCIRRAYDEKFDTPEIAPIHKTEDVCYLELFHGRYYRI